MVREAGHRYGLVARGQRQSEQFVSCLRVLAKQLEEIFMQDLEGCEQVTVGRWRRRGLKTRIFGVTCVFLKEQI